MSTPERIIKSVFFQARKMDVYEQNPDLVKDLAAAVLAEREALEQYANPDFYMFLMDPIGHQTDPTEKAKKALATKEEK